MIGMIDLINGVILTRDKAIVQTHRSNSNQESGAPSNKLWYDSRFGCERSRIRSPAGPILLPAFDRSGKLILSSFTQRYLIQSRQAARVMDLTDTEFSHQSALSIAKSAIETSLKDCVYNRKKVLDWSNALVAAVLLGLQSLNKPLKYAVTCVLMQKTGAGLVTSASCFWDPISDGLCTVLWENATIYCIVTVYGRHKVMERPAELRADLQPVYDALSIKMQHDINCISDPDRHLRRRSLEKLYRSLHGSELNVHQDILREFFRCNLKKPLLSCASADPIEKCRELSLQMIGHFIEKEAVTCTQDDLQDLVNLLHARLGKIPYPEPTEEIRLLILRIYTEYMRKIAMQEPLISLRDVISDICNALGKAALDPYPDVKKAVSECIIVVSKHWPKDVKLQLGTVIKPLIGNLKHQHSRIRVYTLQAIQQIIPCGSEALPLIFQELLEPALKKLMFDNAPAVRKQLNVAVATWMDEIEGSKKYHGILFPIFLSAFVDESTDVRNSGLQQMQKYSEKWMRRCSDGEQESEIILDEAVPILPWCDDVDTLQGSRLLAISILNDTTMNQFLEKTLDWTIQVKEKYLKISGVYYALIGRHVNKYLEKIFNALSTVCQHEEPMIIDAVRQICIIIGKHADQELVLSSLIQMLSGKKTGTDTSHHRARGLTLLGMTIEGMDDFRDQRNDLNIVLEALTATNQQCSDTEALGELAYVIASIIDKIASLILTDNQRIFKIFWILNNIMAVSKVTSSAYGSAEDTLMKISNATNESVQQLYGIFQQQLLDGMHINTEKLTRWDKSDREYLLFDFVCRRSGKFVADNMEKLIPAILLHLDSATEPSLRLAFLALLQTLLECENSRMAFKVYSRSVILEGITPNIIWKGGREAATIRKVAMACLYTIFRHQLADQSCLFETAPEIFPVLKSLLDDFDANTRHLVCLTFEYLFQALPGRLGEEPVHQLYSELLKRLDDSSDIVRKAACKTLIAFSQASPPEYFAGTVIEYILNNLFIHLDDPDVSIQSAIFEVLKHAAKINAALVVEKAKENQSRHHHVLNP
uniref:Uncharacterized protein AlNc14C17G1802 n=1 Tax=Albugo laibachii Nc14 TaxID=890382 RepID=F0W4H9_9STRA|nr:conserved hypothetical protein [Albugo laibachii Nc14]|eukprot:CCA16012.1 conserved hypothetical protein [Albugo laibachii Nc14]